MPFKKGQSGNPKGKPKGTLGKWTKLRHELMDALDAEAKKRGTTFLKHVAEQAYEDKQVLNNVLAKLLPDLKSVEGTLKSDGLTLTIVCSKLPEWKKNNT